MIYAVLIAYGLAMTGWGAYWRYQAEKLVDENFALRFGATDSAEAGSDPTGMDDLIDDLLFEALMPPARIVAMQRRPEDAS